MVQGRFCRWAAQGFESRARRHVLTPRRPPHTGPPRRQSSARPCCAPDASAAALHEPPRPPLRAAPSMVSRAPSISCGPTGRLMMTPCAPPPSTSHSSTTARLKVPASRGVETRSMPARTILCGNAGGGSANGTLHTLHTDSCPEWWPESWLARCHLRRHRTCTNSCVPVHAQGAISLPSASPPPPSKQNRQVAPRSISSFVAVRSAGRFSSSEGEGGLGGWRCERR